jgi:hypothetical protein
MQTQGLESETVESLLRDMLEWIARQERGYAEVMEAWRTSCPRLPVWEEANDRGLVARRRGLHGTVVTVTAAGRAYLSRQ